MSADFDGISSMFGRLSAAWQTNDGNAVAGFFTEDGSLINPFGQRADGRDAIAAMYSAYFAGMLHGTSTVINLTRLRPIEPVHAFGDSEQTILGANGEVLLAVHLGALLRREGDDWLIVDARPYTFATIPG